MNLRFLSIGISLLVFGVFFAYGLFAYPEYFLYGAGLAGLGAVLSPFGVLLLGAAFVYVSFRKESVSSNSRKRKTKATKRGKLSSTFSPPIRQTKVGGFCGNCGNPVEAGSQYCGTCGEKV